VFRVQRFSEAVGPQRIRYVLRATPLRADGIAREAAFELDTDQVRDKIRRGQAIPTPEETYEQLWQQLRLDL